MNYRLLGRTGVRLSVLGLGCGNFGGIGSAPEFFGQGEDERAAHRLLDAAYDAGINWLDTADAYGGGRSHAYIASWLRAKSGPVRDRLLLCTKVFNPVGPGPNQRGLSRLHVIRQVETSLRQLGTDCLDLFMIHEPDPETPLEETLRALDDLIRQGKLLYIGACNLSARELGESLRICERWGLRRFEWVQNSYSLLDRADETEVLPLCRAQGLGYTPFGPLAGGWLSGKYRRGQPFPAGSRMTLRPQSYLRFDQPRIYDALEELERRAADHGADLPTLALAWLLARPEVTALVMGPRRPEHLAPGLRALELELSEDERREIGRLFEI